MNRVILILLLAFGITATLWAQEPDSLRRGTVPAMADTVQQDSLPVTSTADTAETRRERRQRERQEKEAKAQEEVIFKDSARLVLEALSAKAWKRSLVIPGWGQYTNGGLWWIKVPVIYGGFVSAGLVFEFNNRYYREILREVQYRVENNHAQPPNTRYPHLPAESWATERMISAKDYYRRNRDLTVLVTAGWWGLQVVEAYVNSMLKYRWDVSDDLGFKVTPTLISQPVNAFAYKQPYAVGFKIGLQF
ncbi:hypothetical protein SAMN05421747_102225 [Parapedobacter composti]|uniref:DUF5683 domain-containing protein n=1 Tax=Parapedobacter composti TaxID=623281 RepID=A0A1I1F4U5_9SPHI|nr:DUF5683 domain-containing protein [Parapedobacter composti]SFB93952.1 hypothetical protein SAMN05421747_102225 [Parapedobacter composti]